MTEFLIPAGVPSTVCACGTYHTTATPCVDREAVLEGVAELVVPRRRMLARARASALELAPIDDGTAEGFLRRELFLGLTEALAEVDADAIFGEGKDGTEPSQLVGLLGDSGAALFRGVE